MKNRLLRWMRKKHLQRAAESIVLYMHTLNHIRESKRAEMAKQVLEAIYATADAEARVQELEINYPNGTKQIEKEGL